MQTKQYPEVKTLVENFTEPGKVLANLVNKYYDPVLPWIKKGAFDKDPYVNTVVREWKTASEWFYRMMGHPQLSEKQNKFLTPHVVHKCMEIAFNLESLTNTKVHFNWTANYLDRDVVELEYALSTNPEFKQYRK